MRYPEHYNHEDKLIVMSAMRKYLSAEGQMAMEWDKCRPSDQFRRADILHGQVVFLLRQIHRFEEALSKVVEHCNRIQTKEESK